ncbi:hypothetical protein AUC69_14250 [Methyloceanibacter superfactus]|uniref:Phasin domain-containing protein n=1 Tax=Methyloceanibacter superfactus TaxID=1774969 RepID=A0A1E3VTA2_9HYPH|nr:phasin family protein [Methyloceanibacter superfactus]ODR96747.1 hypothetical protein AUC69_14250 [Methyloceanibacter superfactus]
MFDYSKASNEFQKLGKDNYDAMVRSYGELNRGFQDIGAQITGYSKQAFAEATRTFEKLVGAKSLEHVIEIQSQYAKTAFDNWVAEARRSARSSPPSAVTPISRLSRLWPRPRRRPSRRPRNAIERFGKKRPGVKAPGFFVAFCGRAQITTRA